MAERARRARSVPLTSLQSPALSRDGLSEKGVDLSDVGGWLGQTDIRTTRNSYVPILKSRMQRSGEAIDGRLSGWNVERKHGAPVDLNLRD